MDGALSRGREKTNPRCPLVRLGVYWLLDHRQDIADGVRDLPLLSWLVSLDLEKASDEPETDRVRTGGSIDRTMTSSPK